MSKQNTPNANNYLYYLKNMQSDYFKKFKLSNLLAEGTLIEKGSISCCVHNLLNLDAVESIEKQAKRTIGNDRLVVMKLRSLKHRRRVASLSIFYRLQFGECATEIHNLIPPSPFHHRTTRRTAMRHRHHNVDIPPIRTKRFGNTLIVRTAKE